MAQLGKSGESGLALVQISCKSPYLPCLADKDKINYAVTPVDGNLYKDICHLEDFTAGCLLCLEGVDGLIHVVLPPAFGLDLKLLLVMYKPAKCRVTVRANVELIDNDGENLLNDVVVAEVTEYCDPQTDEVHRSGLGLEPLPTPELNPSLLLSLATLKLGSQLVSAHVAANRKEREVKASKSLAVKSSDHSKGDDAPKQHHDDSLKQHWDDASKQNCDDGHRPKQSLSPDGSARTNVNHRKHSASQEKDSQSKQLSMAETRSLISKLLKNCTILNDCHNCVFLAMKHIMERRCKETSEPFTIYMDKVSTTVMTWHSRILPIHNKMSSCGYDKFRAHSAAI